MGATCGAFGVGLKGDAVTFNRLALVGERGAADALLLLVLAEDARDAVACTGGVPPVRLLKGGIG